MAWKPKEKDLTAEEAVALARKELEPLWFRSDPLICGVVGENGPQAVPIDSGFLKKSWLMVFTDPTLFSGDAVYRYVREWSKRYSGHGLGFLLVFRQAYRFYRDRPVINAIIDREEINLPLVVDAEGALAHAFGVTGYPQAVLIRTGGQVIHHSAGKNWSEDLEPKIQAFLWESDPGLPLSPPADLSIGLSSDWYSLEFGFDAAPAVAAKFPLPQFPAGAETKRTVKFAGMRTDQMEPLEVFLAGEWTQEADRMVTHDPQATIGVTAPSGRVSILAESLGKHDDLRSSKIVVMIHDKSAYEAVAGDSLTLDESGQSLVRVREARVYPILKALPAKDREITFKMINADREPIAIYGIRYGD